MLANRRYMRQSVQPELGSRRSSLVASLCTHIYSFAFLCFFSVFFFPSLSSSFYIFSIRPVNLQFILSRLPNRFFSKTAFLYSRILMCLVFGDVSNERFCYSVTFLSYFFLNWYHQFISNLLEQLDARFRLVVGRLISSVVRLILVARIGVVFILGGFLM